MTNRGSEQAPAGSLGARAADEQTEGRGRAREKLAGVTLADDRLDVGMKLEGICASGTPTWRTRRTTAETLEPPSATERSAKQWSKSVARRRGST